MHSTTLDHTTTAPRAGELAQQFTADGFVPGAPPHVGLEVQAIDRRVCRQLRCPACRRRWMAYHPWHRGEQYRVLAVCQQPGCGGAEEV